MPITTNLALSSINFEGFSTSPGWVGYFGKKRSHRFALSLVDEAVALTSDFFGPCWKDFFVVSALAYGDSIEGDKKIINAYDYIYENAKKWGYLKPISSEFERYLWGDAPLAATSLSLHFDNNHFSDMCKLVIAHGDVCGQVFFMININLKIILYPHDDLGFGVISLDASSLLSRDFLDYIMSASDNFELGF